MLRPNAWCIGHRLPCRMLLLLTWSLLLAGAWKAHPICAQTGLMEMPDAQTEGVLHYTPENGLDQRWVTCVEEDQDGFIWVAGQGMVQRFDGYTFQSYPEIYSDKTHVTIDMLVDRSNRIWLHRHDQVLVWDIRADSLWAKWNFGTDIPGCSQLQEGPDGRMYAAFGQQMFVLDAEGVVQWARLPASFHITSFLMQGKDSVWLVNSDRELALGVRGTSTKLKIYPINAERFTKGLYPGPNGTVLMDVTERNAANFHPRTKGAFALAKGSNETVQLQNLVAQGKNGYGIVASRTLALDRNGAFWVIDRDLGLTVFRQDRPNGPWFRGRSLRMIPDEASTTVCYDLHIGRDGVGWIASSEGLWSVPMIQAPVQRVLHSPSNNAYEVGASVRSFLENPDGSYWTALWQTEGPYTIQRIHHGSAVQRIPMESSVRSVCRVGSDSLYALSLLGKHYRLHPADDSFQLTSRWSFPAESELYGLCQLGRSGRWLLGPSSKGLFLGSLDARYPKPIEDTRYAFANNVVYDIVPAENKRFLLATENGVVLYSLEKGVEWMLGTMPHADVPLPIAASVLGVDQIEDDLWISTTGDGLWRYSYNTGHIRHYTVQDGLGDNFCYGVLGDGKQAVWISTNKGLSRLDLNTESFEVLRHAQGLTSNEFNRNARMRLKDGTLLFGSINGISAVDPSEFQATPPFHKKVFPTQLTVYENQGKKHTYTGHAVSGMDKLVLNGNTQSFRLRIGYPDYAKPRENRYAFRLEGHHDEWSAPGADPFVQFHRLRKGQYTLRARAFGSDGQWTVAPFALPIVVHPPFFRSIWFYSMVAAIVFGLAILFYRIRVDRLLEMERLRTRIASNLHDELGSKMTRISIYSDAVRHGLSAKATLDVKDEVDALGEVQDISRSVISAMSDVIWSIDARYDKLEDLLARMRAFADEMLTIREVATSWETKDLPLDKTLNPFWRQQVFLIYKEAINNVCKHGHSVTQVHICLACEGQTIHLSIRDNGHLASNQKTKREGQGISNMHRRAQSMHGSASIGPLHSGGFLVRVQLPLAS